VLLRNRDAASGLGTSEPARRVPPRGGLFGRIADVLMHVDEPPARVAAAFALGAGLGFSPFLGFQILAGVTLAFVLRLNKLAVTAGLFINLPWIQVPYYWIATAAAGWAIGTPVPDDLRDSFASLLSTSPFGRAFWIQLQTLMLPWLVPFAIGTFVGGVAAAALAYAGALAFLQRRRRQRHGGTPSAEG
jgi:uncharacterized protein (DUF2062 family)